MSNRLVTMATQNRYLFISMAHDIFNCITFQPCIACLHCFQVDFFVKGKILSLQKFSLERVKDCLRKVVVRFSLSCFSWHVGDLHNRSRQVPCDGMDVAFCRTYFTITNPLRCQ